MSNILRGPMFRGGPVSSYGTGIASGLGYEDGGRVGYEEGGSTSKDDVKQKVIEQVMIEFPDATLEEQIKIAGQRLGSEESFLDNSGIGSVLKTIGNLGLDATSSIMDTAINVPINTVGRLFGYNPGLSANKNVEEIKKGIFGDNAEIYDPNDPDRDEDANPDVAEFFGINTSAESTKDRRERDAKELIEIEKNKIKKAEGTGTGAGTGGDGTGLNNFQEKSDKDVMQEYMDMFKETLGGDKDELNRQRYLEIAKFGANILAQPGGQSLGEVVGKAGGPALEGFSKIEEAERAADRQAKTLGFQAALKELEPGSLEKNAKALAKLTGTSVAEAAKTISQNASAGRNRMDNIKLIYESLSKETSPGIALKVSTFMTDNSISPAKVSKHPDPTQTTGDEVTNQYYYFEKEGPGGEFFGRWDGKKFLLPGEEGF